MGLICGFCTLALKQPHTRPLPQTRKKTQYLFVVSREKEVQVKENGRPDSTISSPSFLHFSFFTAPSLLPSWCTSLFLYAPFIPLIDGLHLWKRRGFGNVYDYWIQNGKARGREEDSKGTWKKRWKVTLLTLGSVDGGTREGQQNKSTSTVRGRKLIPPRCCANVGRGARLPHWRSGHQTPPYFSVWSP